MAGTGSRLLRVFPRRTSYTPSDSLAFVGDPPLWRPDSADVAELHVSVTFTWDRQEGERLAEAWQAVYPDARVLLGGPAYGSPCEAFMPGRYVREGITFTSRGCDRRCPWCLVPEREGRLRLIEPVPPGNVVNDNNFLACPSWHRSLVYQMLREQPRAAVFAGGLDCRLVTDEVAEEFRTIRIAEVFLACDTRAALVPLRQAVKRLGWLGREKLRCFVMVGFGGETIDEARERLEAVWEAGAMPFCQLYRPPRDARLEYPPEWRVLQKEWSRPAPMKSMHPATVVR